MALALLAGYVGYSGVGAWMAVAPLFALAWGMSTGRRHAFLIGLAYYAAAGRGLFHGGGVFFAGVDTREAESMMWGGFVWLAPSILLATVWGLCWSVRRLCVGASIALLLVSIPPVGQIGWANPLSSAGFWFPGMGWFGLLLMAATMLAMVRWGSIVATSGVRFDKSIVVIVGAMMAVVLSNALWAAPPAPRGWVGVQTHLSRTDGWEALESVQDAVGVAMKDKPRIIVLPEAVGGDWDLNKLYWATIAFELRKNDVTVVLGADRALDSRRRVNALYTVGAEGGQEWPDRAPVPLGMWNPFSKTRHIVADFTGTGVRRLDGVDTLYLICYEQLLVWPVLRSAMLHPQALVGASNLWWANGTSIPGIQKATLAAWGRLFNLPVVLAVND
ncbi:hypothetical protein PWP93_36315 [Paraburkholderia sp. A1RI-2L]|uniref:hypothetical protein n=1 Tax=Paraburkholderia sp. A1RI-2L TaxID=3028367 RepID=UPI003B77131B